MKNIFKNVQQFKIVDVLIELFSSPSKLWASLNGEGVYSIIDASFFYTLAITVSTLLLKSSVFPQTGLQVIDVAKVFLSLFAIALAMAVVLKLSLLAVAKKIPFNFALKASLYYKGFALLAVSSAFALSYVVVAKTNPDSTHWYVSFFQADKNDAGLLVDKDALAQIADVKSSVGSIRQDYIDRSQVLKNHSKKEFFETVKSEAEKGLSSGELDEVLIAHWRKDLQILEQLEAGAHSEEDAFILIIMNSFELGTQALGLGLLELTKRNTLLESPWFWVSLAIVFTGLLVGLIWFLGLWRVTCQVAVVSGTKSFLALFLTLSGWLLIHMLA